MNSDTAIVICGTILIVLFYGDPDIVDGIIKYLSKD